MAMAARPHRDGRLRGLSSPSTINKSVITSMAKTRINILYVLPSQHTKACVRIQTPTSVTPSPMNHELKKAASVLFLPELRRDPHFSSSTILFYKVFRILPRLNRERYLF